MNLEPGDLRVSSQPGAAAGAAPSRAAGRGRRPLTIAMVGQKGLPAKMGGVEKHVEEVGSRLASRGHEVLVFCRSSYGTGTPHTYRGMTLVEAPTVATKHLDAIVHSAASTLMALGRRPDVVHYHALGPALLSPVPRYLSGAAVVLTVHGLDHQRDKWGGPARAVLGVAHWMSGRVPNDTVVVSQSLAAHYGEHFAKAVTCIPNGVPTPVLTDDSAFARSLGLVPGQYALFVGRLVPEKRPDLLIEAVLGSRRIRQVAIVGDTSFTPEYSAQLRELAGDDPRVVFPGFVGGRHLDELFQRAGVFVQPSDLEGLPLTLLEAIANGSPVVASDIAPHVEILGAGSPAHRLFARGDVDSLRAALEQVLAGVPAASGDELRSRVLEHYSWDAATDRLEELYVRTVDARQGRPR
ncbi:glycosyltransferase family 4 protein [Terrabacter sp. BE26]|uniref:glycosyltransferase family 4 protein n=1 Tax=Terrabacter sp. BE26 TaxID=2898152 RepID=UPI0035BEA0E1